MDRLKSKTVVITAGYGDIGRATCRRCCEEGATVIMTGRKPLKEGAAIARRTQAQARRAPHEAGEGRRSGERHR